MSEKIYDVTGVELTLAKSRETKEGVCTPLFSLFAFCASSFLRFSCTN